MGRDISNSDDVIDSRDVIARIEELEGERDSWEPDAEIAHVEGVTWEDANPDDAAELKALEALAEEADGYASDWKYGATLIRDSYFEDYARELASDLGMMKDDLSWPHNCIDWERAAEELKQDYTSVEFDGVTYWVR